MATIITGDCLFELKKIETESIDAIITDPPYGIDYQSAWRTDTAKRLAKIQNDTKPFIWFLYDAYRIIKPGGCLILFCRFDVQDVFKMALEAAGFDVKSQVIWDKKIHGMGDLTGAFSPQHENIWFCTKGDFKFPKERPSSIISVSRVFPDKLTHPNEKPVDLMAYLCRSVSAPGGAILDPFCGSGSTGVAAIKEGFDFIGIEIDPKYSELAQNRIDLVKKQPSLF